jgi:hypothetical protein
MSNLPHRLFMIGATTALAARGPQGLAKACRQARNAAGPSLAVCGRTRF